LPTFVYEAEGVTLEKTIAAIHGENTTVVLYDVLEAPPRSQLELRPLIAYRDLPRAPAREPARSASPTRRFQGRRVSGRVRTRARGAVPPAGCRGFDAKPDWYFGFEYTEEKLRGLVPPKTCSATRLPPAGSRRASASA